MKVIDVRLVNHMDVVLGLDAWFAERLQGLNYRQETLAYVAGVLKTQGKPAAEDCLAGKSIVLAYQEAKSSADFAQYQRLGDWILFVDVVMPDSIKTDREIVLTLGRMSYLACYRMLRYKWDLYEELADQLPVIAQSVRDRLVLK